MKKDFFKKLGEQIQKDGKTIVDVNGEEAVEISLPKLVLSTIKVTDKNKLKEFSKCKPKFTETSNLAIKPPVK